MDGLFRFPNALKRDPEVEAWMIARPDDLGLLARYWFDVIRECGDDVCELIHDGAPTACVSDAAFVYVNAYTAHVNVGFFRGAELRDPAGILEGGGKYMRHVKLRLNRDTDEMGLRDLIDAAYLDMRRRLAT